MLTERLRERYKDSPFHTSLPSNVQPPPVAVLLYQYDSFVTTSDFILARHSPLEPHSTQSGFALIVLPSLSVGCGTLRGTDQIEWVEGDHLPFLGS